MTDRPDFIPGESVNRKGWKRGDRPGIVVAIRYVPKIEVRWPRWNGTPCGMTHLHSPEDLRHGE